MGHVVAFDLGHTMAFLRSVVVGRALAENTHARWTPEMSNTVVNFMYNLLPWTARFGVVEIHQPSRRYIAERMAANYRQCVSGFLDATSRGSIAVKNYIESMNKVRYSDIENLRTLCAEAQAVNQQALGEMATAIRGMAAVQMTSTIAVACLGGYAAIAVGGGVAAMAGTVGTVSSVANTVVKTWYSVQSASAIGVACEYGKGIGEDLAQGKAGDMLGEAGGKLYQEAGEQYLKERKLWEEACRRIERQSHQVARSSKARIRNAKALTAARAQRDAAGAQMRSAARRAGRAPLLRNSIPVVFALWDCVEAVGDYNEVYEATR